MNMIALRAVLFLIFVILMWTSEFAIASGGKKEEQKQSKVVASDADGINKSMLKPGSGCGMESGAENTRVWIPCRELQCQLKDGAMNCLEGACKPSANDACEKCASWDNCSVGCTTNGNCK